MLSILQNICFRVLRRKELKMTFWVSSTASLLEYVERIVCERDCRKTRRGFTTSNVNAAWFSRFLELRMWGACEPYEKWINYYTKQSMGLSRGRRLEFMRSAGRSRDSLHLSLSHFVWLPKHHRSGVDLKNNLTSSYRNLWIWCLSKSERGWDFSPNLVETWCVMAPIHSNANLPNNINVSEWYYAQEVRICQRGGMDAGGGNDYGNVYGRIWSLGGIWFIQERRWGDKEVNQSREGSTTLGVCLSTIRNHTKWCHSVHCGWWYVNS